MKKAISVSAAAPISIAPTVTPSIKEKRGASRLESIDGETNLIQNAYKRLMSDSAFLEAFRSSVSTGRSSKEIADLLLADGFGQAEYRIRAKQIEMGLQASIDKGLGEWAVKVAGRSFVRVTPSQLNSIGRED